MMFEFLVMRHFGKTGFWLAVWFSLISLACNLASSDAPPPTLAPRITSQAVATLGYSTPVPGELVPTPTPGMPATPIATKLYTMLGQVEADRLMSHITVLAKDFHTRHVDSVGKTDGTGISAAYEYLNNEFTKIQNNSNGRFANLSPQNFEMPSTKTGKTTQRNVVGVINGTEAGRSVIVVGAHYDSRTDDITDSTSAAPGADDNGSGVAAVIELARVMSQYPSRATILFALFAGEEQGRYGSIAFVRDYIKGTNNNIPVMVMINLDTIGNVHDRRGNINDTQLRLFADPNHPPSRWMAEMIGFIADNNATDLKVVVQNSIDREGRFGDHQSFSTAGYPAVRFIEAFEDSNHREGRDFVEEVDAYYLVKSTRTVMSVLVALADGPPPPDPRNIVIRDSGNGTNRLVWEQVPEAVGYVVALRRAGESTFGQVFNAPGTITAYDFSNETLNPFQGLAIAAVSSEGIMGPLSSEYIMRTTP